MHQVLKSYQKRLVNLTSTNKSLLLRKLLVGQYIDVHRFDYLMKEPSFEIVKKLIAGKGAIALSPIADSRDEHVNHVNRDLTRLKRVSDFLFDEHGSQDLYLGWPFVKGKFSDGTHVHAPVVFFPVKLTKKDTFWEMNLRADINAVLNKTFLLAYGYYNGVKIGEEITEKNLEEFETDPLVFITSLYQFYKDNPIEVNFNSDNFTQKLHHFTEFTKSSFDELHKDGELKLFPEAVLGIFPQSGSYLVPDYDKLQEENRYPDLESFFASRHSSDTTESKYAYLNKVKEDVTFTPLKMDAFQENALKAAKLGKSFVVQGPPGTGKSQLICNLISDFIARGKRVLLVSQKRAALDVVHQRFETLDMQPFMGLVHDFRNDRKSIYEQLAHQIAKIEEYKHLNNNLDTIQLERQFMQYSHQIDQLTEQMEEFRQALYDETECGMSVKELYLSSQAHSSVANVKQEYKYFHFSEMASWLNQSKRYSSYASLFRTDEYPLLDRKSFANYDIATLKQLLAYLEEMPRVNEAIAGQTKAIVGHPIQLEECLSILSKKDRAKELLGKLKLPKVYEFFGQIMQVHTRDSDYTWLSDHERRVMACFAGAGVEKTLKNEEFGTIQSSLQVAIEARRNVFKYIKWWVFTKDRKRINKLLDANELKKNRAGLKTLIQRIDNRLNLDHNLSLLSQKKWVSAYDEPLDKGLLQNWYHAVKEAFRCKLIMFSYRNFKEYFNTNLLTYKELSEKINALYQVIDNIPEAWNRWSLLFTESQLLRLTTDAEWHKKITLQITKDFDNLCDFDALCEAMPSHEMAVANAVLEALDSFDPKAYEAVLLNSIKLQWIDHIETKYPILRSVSSRKFKQMEADLQNNVREKLRISNEILLVRAREGVYENVAYNRLNNRVTYREINHQVTKQRRIWPLRKLIDQFSDELFNLIPCWMASPEAVSAIFPMEPFFDIVIFDEASQCFTERGIPAMYRGKQLVVAGDSKQLRPNDIYKARWSEIEEDDIALEVDSLLELSEQYLMNVNLKGHYRSKKPELIEFSNRHFYHNELRLLPDKKLINNQTPAVTYIKLDGVWENNTNVVEAEKVIELLKMLDEEAPGKSIGVVTFNARQQELVLDLLDKEVANGRYNIPKNLLVKNIENVQGDERDIIIFTTAYAPNTSGKLMLQFGSLNIAGGENRLNVAVTRACERIYMVTSIWPDQLKTDKVKNKGPKLLKEYLSFARSVSEGKYQPKPVAPIHSQANWYLKQQLMHWAKDQFKNLQFVNELPFADITIKHGTSYEALLITDDDLYYQNPSVKDLHAYTPFTLSKHNWRFIGFFSREWWMQPQEVQEAIIRFINLNVEE